MTSQRIEEYLESIYKLEEQGDTATITKLANYLGISPASVSEMVKKLAAEGYIKISSKKILLSKSGSEVALAVIRRHRLSERLLTDMLGMDWENSHEKACELEHVISSEIADKIDQNLGFPKTCPHGYPIPSKNGNMTLSANEKLSELPSGKEAEIVTVPEEDEEVLKYLGSIGLKPSSKVRSTGEVPFSETISFDLGTKNISLSKELAAKIRIRRAK